MTDSDLELLEQYEAGTLSLEARAAFEVELQKRPELRAALDGAKAVERALPLLAEPTLDAAKAEELSAKILSPAPEGEGQGEGKSRLFVLLAAAAALIALGVWRFGFDEIESLGGMVRVDGKTLIAGESITSPDEVLTADSSAAIVRRKRSTWLIPPSTQLSLRANTLERGAVVVQGESRLWIQNTAIETNGECVISVEPIEGAFRETRHLEPGDVMNTKMIKVGGATLGAAALTIYVLSGSAWITAPDEMSATQVDAGAVWTSTSSRTTAKRPRPPPDFREWDSTPSAPAKTTGAPNGFDASVGLNALGSVNSNEPADGRGANGTAPVAKPKQYTLDREGISGAVRSKLPDIEECYSGWQQQQPNLAGRMVIGFQIGPNDAGVGSVQQLSVVDGGLGHALMEGCVMNAVSDLTFDRPDEPLTVNYPFLFSVEADAGP